MTCVVGIRHADGVLLAADSAVSDRRDMVMLRAASNPKAWSVDERLVIGSAGSCRYSDAWRSHGASLTRSAVVADAQLAHLISEVVPAVRADCARFGDECDGNALIGWNGALYEVERGWGVIEHGPGVYATGSGDAVALGAALAATRLASMTPRELATLVLEIASELVTSVRGPWVFASSGRCA